MTQNEFEHIAKTIRAQAVNVSQCCGADSVGAEDIAQDTMLKLWMIHDTLSGQKEMRALAVTIAKRLTIDSHRRQHTEPIDPTYTVIDDCQPAPDIALEANEDQEWLRCRLDRLPATELQILRMRQVELRTNDEIAAILGIELTSVCTMLSRARHRLLDDIKKRMKGEK